MEVRARILTFNPVDTYMNKDKIDDVTLALFQLVMRRDGGGSGMHASTHFDGATLQRLRDKGLIGEIDEQAGVVTLTGEGAERSRALFEQHFRAGDSDSRPAEVQRVEADASDDDAAESDVYLHDAFLDAPVNDGGALQALVLETVERNALLDQLSSRQLKGGVYVDTSEEKVIRLGESDPAPPSEDQRFLKVESLPADDYWHDMSDFASLVRNGDLAAWIHNLVDDCETVEAFREQLDRVEGLLDAWIDFEHDRARHRLDRLLASHGYELAE